MKFKGTFVSDLSGSLGGLVASRNKAGGYLRQRITPTNPQTEVQMQNRSAFASAGSSYHALTPQEKALWNTFAAQDFTPRNGRVPGATYSGQQAYTSLLATVNRSNQLIRETEVDGDTLTATPFIFASAPPVGQMSARIAGSTSSNPSDGFAITLKTASMSVDGILTTSFTIGDGITVSGLNGVLRTVGDNQQFVGINFYVSQKGGQQQGLNYGGKLSLIGSTGRIVIGGAVTTPDITVNMPTADLNLTGRKTWFTSEEYVQIHAFLVGNSGQTQPIGTVVAQTYV